MAFLRSVDIVNYTDCFVNVKPNLHSWDLPQLVMIHDPFYIFLELICQNFFFQEFCAFSLWISCNVFVWFAISVMFASQK